MKKLILSFMVVLFSSSLAFANPADKCQNVPEFFAPLGKLIIDNAGNPPLENLCQHLSKARIYNKILGNESEVIRQLEIIQRISTNQAPDNISQGAADAFISEAQRLIDILDDEKETLLGIDLNNNKIRDDTEAFILETWPDSERVRALMSMAAKGMQQDLEIADDKAAARAVVDGMGRGYLESLCFGYMEWKYGIDGYKELIEVLEPQVLNTWERRKRDTLFGKQLSGMVPNNGKEIPFSKAKQYCDFDPDALFN